jgi:hypothetical protein
MMDWSFYSSEGKSEEPVHFWTGPRPDVRTLVECRNVPGLVNALTYNNASIRSAAAEGLTRIAATHAVMVSRTIAFKPSSSRHRKSHSTAAPVRMSEPEPPAGLGGFFDSPPDVPIGNSEKRVEPAQDPRKKKKDEDPDPSGLSALFG